MTYAADIEGDHLDISYRLRFEGIERVITQRVFGDGELASMVSASAGEARLDRRRSLVTPAGFSAVLTSDDDTLGYFARRGGTETALAASITGAATSVNVGTGTNTYANGSTVYLDRETIILGTGTAGVYAGCTRGAFSSQAVAHAQHAIISDRPRFWRRRRAWLEAIVHPSGEVGGVLGGVLSESPKLSDPRVSLDFLDIATELNRPVCTGWQDVPILSVEPSESPIGYDLTIADGYQIRVGGLASRSFLKIFDADNDDDWVIMRIAGITSNPSLGTLTIPTSRLVWGTVTLDSLMQTPALACRQVCVLTGKPEIVALQLMLSNLGTVDNDWDDLPGLGSSDVGSRKRMGAGLPLDSVNVESWNLSTAPDPGDPLGLPAQVPPMTLLLDEPARLIDVLAAEILWRLGGYVYADEQGRLAFRRNEGTVPAANIPEITIDQQGQAAIAYSDDESEVISHVSFESSWSYVSRSFRRKDQVIFGTAAATYGEETDSAKFSSRSLVVGEASANPLASAPVPASYLELMADRMASRVARGVERFPVRLPWRHSGLGVGRRVLLTDHRLPNGTGSRGFTRVQCEVVGEKWDLGSVEKQLMLEVVGRGWLIAPGAVITSGATTSNLPILDTLSMSSKPARDFRTNWGARVFFGPDFTTSAVRQVRSVTDTVITLWTALGSSPPAGSVVILEPSADEGSNQWGAEVFDHIILADTAGVIGDGEAWEQDASRWQ